VLNGNADACKGVLFASAHIDGYPNPGNQGWKSVSCPIPKGHKRAFEIKLREELLPSGVTEDGEFQNDVVLSAFNRWKTEVAVDLHNFNPDGIFIGLGLDLHKYEKRIEKAIGIGLEREHYCRFFKDLPTAALNAGPVVLTLEGGYTKFSVADGIAGVIEGLEELSLRRKRAEHVASSAQRAKKRISVCVRRLSTSALLKPSKRKLALTSAQCKQMQLSASFLERPDKSKRSAPPKASKRKLSVSARALGRPKKQATLPAKMRSLVEEIVEKQAKIQGRRNL